MRAVLLDVPKELIDERRRQGLDLFDEVWDGVLHMVSPPSSRHQRVAAELTAVLLPDAKAKDLVVLPDTALYAPESGDRNYRVPDLMFAYRRHISGRGVEGSAELVIEILSPEDETHEKLPFYDSLGVTEFLIVDPTACTVELFVQSGEGLHPAPADATGSTAIPSLGVSFATVAGPILQLSSSMGTLDL